MKLLTLELTVELTLEILGESGAVSSMSLNCDL